MPPPLRAAAGHGISYRGMTDSDLPFVAELFASTRREEVAVTGWSPEVQEAFLRQQHEAQHAHYSLHRGNSEWLIIARGAEPIGRLYWREDAGNLHVTDISLVPQERGRGIGGAILRDLLALAHDKGKGVTVYVEKFNPARRLYERLGFAAIENDGVYDLMRAEA